MSKKVLVPFGGKFVARITKPGLERVSSSGIVIPSTSDRYKDEGTVLQVGAAYVDGTGVLREPPPELVVGACVMVNPLWGRLVEDEGNTELRVYSFGEAYGWYNEVES